MADKNTGTLFQVRQAGVFSFRSDGQGLEQGSSEVVSVGDGLARSEAVLGLQGSYLNSTMR